MIYLVLALLIGMVAGLRAMTAPAVTSWGAYHGWLVAGGSAFAFLGIWWVPWALTLLAIAEFALDQTATLPARTHPLPFALRIATGAISGGCIAVRSGSPMLGAALGAVGAAAGTLGGAAFRARLIAGFGQDRPAALLEDGVAVVAALMIVSIA